jgi:hypothetical protein
MKFATTSAPKWSAAQHAAGGINRHPGGCERALRVDGLVEAGQLAGLVQEPAPRQPLRRGVEGGAVRQDAEEQPAVVGEVLAVVLDAL